MKTAQDEEYAEGRMICRFEVGHPKSLLGLKWSLPVLGTIDSFRGKEHTQCTAATISLGGIR